MRREIRVEIDSSSWPLGTKPPRSLSRLAGSRRVDMLLALLHVAVWTRPPQVYGFDLSDCWAFMRYGPALAQTTDLRLRSEWTTLNSHHKTILSDDFGVGLPTMLLCRALRVIEFSDTANVLNLKYPSRFSVKEKPKHGPAKMPDYVGRLPNGGFVVLECKGTQGRLSYLDQAMAFGTVQKQNLVAATGTMVAASLVSGTFIPQWESSDEAVVRFADPAWDDFADALRGMSPSELEQAIVQVATAKQLALTGATQAASVLSSTTLEESVDFRIDPKLLEQTKRVETLRWPRHGVDRGRDERGPSQTLRCTIDATPLAVSLDPSDSIQQAIARLTESTRSHRWIHRHAREERPTEMVTPYGVRLTVDERGSR